MDKLAMTEMTITSKLEKGLSWEAMGKDLGMSPVWVFSNLCALAACCRVY